MRRLLVLLTLSLGLAGVAHCQPAKNAEEKPEERLVPVLGRILWAKHDLSKAQVRLYADPEQRKLIDVYPTGGPNGAFVMALGAGTYYLMAYADDDGDGKVSPGDGVGFLGVVDEESSPQALVVDAGANALSVTIPISLRVNDEMRLEPVPVQPPEFVPSAMQSGISGKVEGLLGASGERLVLLVPLTLGNPPQAATVAADGSFSTVCPPGAYQLMAIENLDQSEAIDTGDLFALLDYSPRLGVSLPVLRLDGERPVKDVSLGLDWALASDGRLRTGDGAELGPRIMPAGLPAVISGTVLRRGQPVPGAILHAYADASLRELRQGAKADAQGHFTMALDSATYYLTAFRDVDGNGSSNTGDELGCFGVTEADPSAAPKALTLKAAELRSKVNLHLVATIDADGKPAALPAEAKP